MGGGAPLTDLLLNLLLFVPLGVSLARLGNRQVATALLTAAASMGIELMQLVTIPGRYATGSDVVANIAGGILGWQLGRHGAALVWPSRQRAALLVLGWGAIAAGTVRLADDLLKPAVSEVPVLFGSWGYPYGRAERFSGRVISASLDRVAIPNHGVLDATAWREQMRQEVWHVDIDIVAGRDTRTPVQIVGLSDGTGRFVLHVEQDGRDVVATLMRRSTIWWLRSPGIRVSAALPDSGSRARIRLARQSDELDVDVISGASRRRGTQPLDWRGGWLLLFPGTVASQRTNDLLCAAWSASLVLPLAWWLGRLVVSSRVRR